jgi:hypothetical protein
MEALQALAEKSGIAALSKVQQDKLKKYMEQLQNREHLMPTAFLGERAVGEQAKTTSTAPQELVDKLVKMAKASNLNIFQMALMKMDEMKGQDALLSDCLDGGPTGFWARAQKVQ